MFIAGEAEGPGVEIRLVDGVEYHLGLEALGVFAHALHEIRALKAADVARPVVHVRGGGHLPAHLQAGDEHRVEAGAGRVDGGSVAGGAGAEDQQSAVFGIGHEELLEFQCAFS